MPFLPPVDNTPSAEVREADVEAAVSLICLARDIMRSKDGAVSGCRVCPANTDFSGETNNKWEFSAAIPGHFTSPQDDNLLLDGAGCDSHANNFGGSFMFTLKSGKARLLKYDRGLVTSRCHEFSFPGGRDFLVCQGGWTGMGENDGTVFMTAFDVSGKDITTNLVGVRDSTYSCGGDPMEGVRNSEIRDIKFSTRDSGEIAGLTVTATLGIIKCSQVKIGEKEQEQPAGVKTYEIEFLYDGKRFSVAPGSKAALNRLESN